MTMIYIAWALGVVFWLNCAATHRVMRSVSFSRTQKKYQLLLVWFVPVVGALVVLSIVLSDAAPLPPSSGRAKKGGLGLLAAWVLLDFTDVSGERAETGSWDGDFGGHDGGDF